MRSDRLHSLQNPDIPGISPEHARAMLLQLAITVALAVRIAIPANILNLFINYSTESGGIHEKIHPGTYLILLLLPMGLIIRPLRLFREELPAVRALAFFTVTAILTTLLMVLMGRANAAGYFIDTYVAASAGGLLLYLLSQNGRTKVAVTVIAIFCISVLMGIFESGTRLRIIPYEYDEIGFRPTGLAGHPLMLGLLSSSAIGFVWTMPWSARQRIGVILLLILGTVAAEARFATIMAGLTVICITLLPDWPDFTPRQQRRGKIALAIIALAILLPGLALLQAAGFMNRLNDGLVDDSSMARVDVYRVFEYVNLRDILIGTDIALITTIVNNEIGIEIIESTPIILIFQLGLPGAFIFTAITIFLFWRLCRSVSFAARFSTIAFFVTALSNITLSTKTPAVLVIVAFLITVQGTRRIPDRKQRFSRTS